jgi:tRNA-5-taurinomethyluridine 2-sulfurtransferase
VKKESMGICFVGKKRAPGNRGFQEFIADYIPARPGNFVDIDTGQVVGQHLGVHQWTIGQRAKIKRSQEPYVVVAKDAATGRIHVAADMDHPALFSESFFTAEPHWISGAPEELSMRSRNDGNHS